MQKFSTESNKDNGKAFNFKAKIAIVVLIIIVALIVVFNCFSVINEGYIGVKYRFGKIVNSSLSAGLNFRASTVPYTLRSRTVTYCS